MRTIHYSLRLLIVVLCVQLLYLGTATLFHQSLQVPVSVTLLLATVGIERLWALLDWMGPVVGVVDRSKLERDLHNGLEREIARSMRYNSSMAIMALRESKRTSLHVVAQYLRSSDAIFRSRDGYLIVIMPETTRAQARLVVDRLTKYLPIQAATLLDEKEIRIALKNTTTPQKNEKEASRELIQAYLRCLKTELSTAEKEGQQTLPISDLSATDILFQPKERSAVSCK